MKLLLDTHVFLWWALEEDRLPGRVAELVQDRGTDLLFSVASVWEAALKIDRLGLLQDFEILLERAMRYFRLSILPVEMRHVLVSARLPVHHRDPFDRLLVAQAIVEDLPIVTGDAAIARYPVRVMW